MLQDTQFENGGTYLVATQLVLLHYLSLCRFLLTCLGMLHNLENYVVKLALPINGGSG